MSAAHSLGRLLRKRGGEALRLRRLAPSIPFLSSLRRYVNEFPFRWNHRVALGVNDTQRAMLPSKEAPHLSAD
jgi:hypothetical protein